MIRKNRCMSRRNIAREKQILDKLNIGDRVLFRNNPGTILKFVDYGNQVYYHSRGVLAQYNDYTAVAIKLDRDNRCRIVNPINLQLVPQLARK